MNKLALLPLPERQSKIDSLIKANHTYPIIENDSTVIFIYKGEATRIQIAGDFTGWMPSITMACVTGTNFFYHIAHFEPDARLEYKFIIDGNWKLDPKNTDSLIGGMGTNSEIKMPSYSLPPEIYFYPVIPHGTLVDTFFYSPELNNNRQVRIYLPPGYSKKNQYPVTVFHDGLEFISMANVVNILDYLISQHKIKALIGVFVPPVDRQNEYAGTEKDLFTEFIVNDLMPAIDLKYSTSKDPQERATFGISDGGNIALYICMKHPETFGKIAAMSSNVQTVISTKFRSSDKMNLQFYMDIGSYDIPELIPMVNDFIQILKDKDYTYQFRKWNEGHSWSNWKTHLVYPLLQFFPPD